jgi:hypothetical protein
MSRRSRREVRGPAAACADRATAARRASPAKLPGLRLLRAHDRKRTLVHRRPPGRQPAQTTSVQSAVSWTSGSRHLSLFVSTALIASRYSGEHHRIDRAPPLILFEAEAKQRTSEVHDDAVLLGAEIFITSIFAAATGCRQRLPVCSLPPRGTRGRHRRNALETLNFPDRFAAWPKRSSSNAHSIQIQSCR